MVVVNPAGSMPVTASVDLSTYQSLEPGEVTSSPFTLQPHSAVIFVARGTAPPSLPPGYDPTVSCPPLS